MKEVRPSKYLSIFLIFLYLPDITLGQKAFVSVTPMINFTEYLGKGHGLNACAAYEVSPALTIGASAGRVNYQDLREPYQTLALHINSSLPLEGQKQRLLMVFEPGWGFYNETFYERNNPTPFKRVGGFNLFAGVGITVPVYKKMNLLILGGYVNTGIEQPEFHYTMGGDIFSAETVNYPYGGFSFRLGLVMN